jgi:hypothetical protein
MLFTAFNAIDRSNASLFAINELTTGTNPVAMIPNESRNLSLLNEIILPSPRRYLTSAANLRKNTRDIGSTPAFDTKVGGYATTRKTTRKMRSMQDLVAMQRPIESTVITYPQFVRASVSEPENYSATIRPAAITEKRSFLSKTGSVLKKPYIWIKALGLKLN